MDGEVYKWVTEVCTIILIRFNLVHVDGVINYYYVEMIPVFS